MEVSVLVSSISAFLSPFLPKLISSGKTIATSMIQEFGKGVGRDTWNKVTELWKKISPSLEKTPDEKLKMESIAPTVQKPGDLDKLAVLFELSLEKIARHDEELMKTLETLITEAENSENGGNHFSITEQKAKYITNINTAYGIHIGDRL